MCPETLCGRLTCNVALETVSRSSEGHERTAPSESSDILASDRADPDIFVLAFQELDLSTEALLYSTKTVREDAWVTAIFAGLGEKAVLYEKVSSVYPEYFVAIRTLRSSVIDFGRFCSSTDCSSHL